jgi:hypothetical protein
MRYQLLAAPALAAAFALSGCSDRQSQTPAEPKFSQTGSASCDFNFNSLISQFFVQPRQGVVAALKQQMEAADAANSPTDVQARGFDILANIEAAVNLGESSNVSAGGSLANDLLACMFTEAQLSPVVLPVDFTSELTISGLGAFGVRGGSTAYDTSGPVRAHDQFSGVRPAAGAKWSTVLTTRTLIYGTRLPTDNNSYDWFKILRSTSFTFPFVTIALCYPSGTSNMVTEDNTVVLAFDGADFLTCPSGTLSSANSGWGPRGLASRLVRLFSPRPLNAATVLTHLASGKGSFSHISVTQVTSASSVYIVAPPPTVVVNVEVTPTITVKVTADGQPAFNQLVSLLVASQISNKGTNVDVAGNTAFTDKDGFATFPHFVIKKAGTYTIQAVFDLNRSGVTVSYDSRQGIQAGGTGKKK